MTEPERFPTLAQAIRTLRFRKWGVEAARDCSYRPHAFDVVVLVGRSVRWRISFDNYGRETHAKADR